METLGIKLNASEIATLIVEGRKRSAMGFAVKIPNDQARDGRTGRLQFLLYNVSYGPTGRPSGRFAELPDVLGPSFPTQTVIGEDDEFQFRKFHMGKVFDFSLFPFDAIEPMVVASEELVLSGAITFFGEREFGKGGPDPHEDRHYFTLMLEGDLKNMETPKETELTASQTLLSISEYGDLPKEPGITDHYLGGKCPPAWHP